MNESSPILIVKDLSAGYGAGRMVADASFTLSSGEILCLVGESGCGKSTLLKAVMGTTPGLQVLSGSIVLEGRSLRELPAKERQRLCTAKFGLISQSPGASFNPIRTYRKQFIETLKSHGKFDKTVFADRVAEAFGKMGLTDWQRILACCPYEMSGGMNQRIALSLALLLEQDILLADEPTSALDATIQLQVAEELLRLRRVSGMAQIIVTHNLALAQFLADRIGSSDWAKGGFKNDECEDLINQLQAETNAAKRAELANRIVQITIDDNAFGYIGIPRAGRF